MNNELVDVAATAPASKNDKPLAPLTLRKEEPAPKKEPIPVRKEDPASYSLFRPKLAGA